MLLFLSCIKILAAKCPDVLRELDENGNSPLHLAKDKEILSMLLDSVSTETRLSHIRVYNRSGMTPLHFHVKRCELGCLVKLFAHGADVNHPDSMGNSPLHIAVQTSNSAVVKALLVFGANVNATNSCGASVRHVAAKQISNSQNEIMEILELAGARRCQGLNSDCSSLCVHKPFEKNVKLKTKETSASGSNASR